MKHVFVGVLIAGSMTAAFAGKEERDFFSKELEPAARGAEAKWKSSCGCSLKIALDEASYSVKHDMYTAKAFCDRVAESITGYCTDGASKKAMCQMKTLVVKKTSGSSSFTFKGGTGTATTEADASPSWDMVTRELDK